MSKREVYPSVALIAADLAGRWCRARSSGKAKVAKELLKGSPTLLIQFVYLLQNYWEKMERGGFNHELDELANYLEPESPLYVEQGAIEKSFVQGVHHTLKIIDGALAVTFKKSRQKKPKGYLGPYRGRKAWPSKAYEKYRNGCGGR